VTVRILADREPYASFADASLAEVEGASTGPPTGSLVILNGPPALDEVSPDIIVMPAAEFLALTRGSLGQAGYIAYGPVALMDRAFEGGCVDYIREPWSLPELYARLGRQRATRFRVGDRLFCLSGSMLRGATAAVELRLGELILFRLLLRNAPLLVTREAAMALLPIAAHNEAHALGRCAVLLRHSLESVEPGLGRKLHAVRGLGYRLDAEPCG
jgi:hypothetical protein